MNKLNKIWQCLKYRNVILGVVGKKNTFRPKVSATSAAIIGNNNYFGDRCMVGNAKIGNYCSFAPDVKIAQSQHSISYLTTYQKISNKNIGYSLNSKRAVIENDVWIGANAVVMQGVHIGNGSVIGANAVVTHDVPDYAIVVGIPAKVIRYRFNPIQIEKLKNSRWWEFTCEEACKILKKLESSEEFNKNIWTRN